MQEYIEETRRVFDDEREEKQLQQAMQEALQRADKVRTCVYMHVHWTRRHA